jgi:cytochrome b561
MSFRVVDASKAYPTSIVAIHWLTFALVAAAYALVELKNLLVRGSELRDAALRRHYIIGIGVIFSLAATDLARVIPVIERAPIALHISSIVDESHNASYLDTKLSTC